MRLPAALPPFIFKRPTLATVSLHRPAADAAAAAATGTAPPPPQMPAWARVRAARFSSSAPREAKNQVFDPVRNPDRLDTYLTVSASSNVPLLTLFTTSYCPSCRTISPLLQKLISSGVGEDQGGINYVTVEFDAPDNLTLGQRYMITSIPTLLSFDRRRSEVVNREVDVRKMAGEGWLEEWIKAEAARDGGGQGGSGGGAGLFGGLFGSWK